MTAFVGLAALLVYVAVVVVVICFAWFAAYRYGRRTQREDIATQVESHRLNETVAKLSTPAYLYGLDDALRIVRGEHPSARTFPLDTDDIYDTGGPT